MLEIALVYDDGVTAVDHLPVFHKLVRPNTTYYEPYAMSMHSDLLKEIHNKAITHTVAEYKADINSFIAEVTNNSKHVTLAGKNITQFDLPILKNNDVLIDHLNHKVIDVGSVFFMAFGYVPSLSEINKLVGIKSEVDHRALEDARDTIRAIRWIMNEVSQK